MRIVRISWMMKFIRKYLPNWLVNYCWHFPKSLLANLVYGFPATKLKVVGVTGTKGKTTVSHEIFHILSKTGKKVALLSTIEAKIGTETIDTGLHVTNPDSFALQKILHKMVAAGCEYAVLEVTSMGLDQFRNWGIPFALAVFTTIQKDHLDYHGTLRAYWRAKARLIDQTEQVLINELDPAKDYLTEYAKRRQKTVIFYAAEKDIDSQNQKAALKATSLLGVADKNAKKALASFPGVPGRMEIIQDKPFTVIIDFAHTTDSLKSAAASIRKRFKPSGMFIGVFGCAGERDHTRRKMGLIAAKVFDAFIITSEDPRSENPSQISAEIASYARKGGAEEI